MWFSDSEAADVAKVGGKNASFGEMTQKLHETGIVGPAGFAIRVAAYWEFVEAYGLRKKIAAALDEHKQRHQSLTEEVGQDSPRSAAAARRRYPRCATTFEHYITPHAIQARYSDGLMALRGEFEAAVRATQITRG
jgi:hypothetical protein